MIVNDSKSVIAQLRQMVTEMLNSKTSADASHHLESEALKLINELDVRQNKLKNQNDELVLAHSTAQQGLDKYLSLFDFAPVGYFILSKEGSIIQANRTGAEMIGKTRSNVLNYQFGFVLSAETRKTFALFLGKMFYTNAKESCLGIVEIEGLNPRHVQFTGAADDTGEKCFISMLDITEQKKMEEEMRKISKNLSSIVDESVDIIWSLFLPDMKVNYVSQSVERIYGRTVRSFNENPMLWAEIVHPDDKEISQASWTQWVKEGSTVRECRIVRPDGGIVWIIDKCKTVYDDKGTPIRVDGFVRDITDRKNVEHERDQLNEKLLSALEKIKTLEGIIPICSKCKKIRDDKGYWEQVETYMYQHSDANLSHGFCPHCLEKHYPGYRMNSE